MQCIQIIRKISTRFLCIGLLRCLFLLWCAASGMGIGMVAGSLYFCVKCRLLLDWHFQPQTGNRWATKFVVLWLGILGFDCSLHKYLQLVKWAFIIILLYSVPLISVLYFTIALLFVTEVMPVSEPSFVLYITDCVKGGIMQTRVIVWLVNF